MHDLVSRAVEKFLDAESVPLQAGAGILSPGQMLRDAALHLGKPVDELIEDLGAWLVRQDEIWRLLRFCGRDFLDFLLRLEELPERIRLVTDDLDVPEIALSRSDDGLLWVTLSDGPPAWTALLGGLLRAMADDYGALCVITRGEGGLCIDVSDSSFAAARIFHLSSRVHAR
ncbi:heme NO-binding domain-containing protein [Paracoccus sp. S3-43]|uniref:heme NO-binding domain-containing protein n=1 Tax=Paracoccus sp. S3-43 TaxID=3030011 RepID=UPI0023AF31FB|nr:heme NO-binding domain-containing protein [Paracoccus sp. S3-43]WEF23330.1 heme NO-binding domain-containing protein [Paracoccus sp. S3-43]